MKNAVNECPYCHKKAELSSEARIKHVYTEINVSAHCPECGCNWDIIYAPDRIEERN